MSILCWLGAKIYTEFHEKPTHALVADATSQTFGRMDVLPTRDSLLLRTERLRMSGRIIIAYCANMSMQDFLNNTFETTKLILWILKYDIIKVRYICDLHKNNSYFFL